MLAMAISQNILLLSVPPDSHNNHNSDSMDTEASVWQSRDF